MAVLISFNSLALAITMASTGNGKRARDDNGIAVPSGKRKKFVSVYRDVWALEYRYMCKSERGPNYAFCKFCKVHISIASGGKHDIYRHSHNEKHRTLERNHQGNQQITSIFGGYNKYTKYYKKNAKN
jgi:hypothetical protein